MVKVDRISRLLLWVFLVSGVAAIIGAIANSLPATQAGGAPARPVAAAAADGRPPAADDATVAAVDAGGPMPDTECDAWQDPLDPMRDSAAPVAHDDEIAEAVSSDVSRARAFVDACTAAASHSPDVRTALRRRYAVGRVELQLGREPSAITTWKAIANQYPAAAWRLAALILQEEAPEPDTPRFEEAMRLLEIAHKGHETRGDDRLVAMILRTFPVNKFELPGLFAALYFNRADLVPDTEEVRMAMLSFYDGYASYCSQWETYPVAPMATAEIENAKLDIQYDRWQTIFGKLPSWSNAIVQWGQGIGNRSFVEILQDFNVAAATPTQILFITNAAAHRDGWRASQTMTCTGRRPARLIGNMIRMLRARHGTRPEKADGADLQRLSQQPDILTLI